MSCVHKNIQGDTTKYYFCTILEKAIDDYQCKSCLMRIEDKKSEEAFNEMFGGVFRDIFGGDN